MNLNSEVNRSMVSRPTKVNQLNAIAGLYQTDTYLIQIHELKQAYTQLSKTFTLLSNSKTLDIYVKHYEQLLAINSNINARVMELNKFPFGSVRDIIEQDTKHKLPKPRLYYMTILCNLKDAIMRPKLKAIPTAQVGIFDIGEENLNYIKKMLQGGEQLMTNVNNGMKFFTESGKTVGEILSLYLVARVIFKFVRKSKLTEKDYVSFTIASGALYVLTKHDSRFGEVIDIIRNAFRPTPTAQSGKLDQISDDQDNLIVRVTNHFISFIQKLFMKAYFKISSSLVSKVIDRVVKRACNFFETFIDSLIDIINEGTQNMFGFQIFNDEDPLTIQFKDWTTKVVQFDNTLTLGTTEFDEKAFHYLVLLQEKFEDIIFEIKDIKQKQEFRNMANRYHSKLLSLHKIFYSKNLIPSAKRITPVCIGSFGSPGIGKTEIIDQILQRAHLLIHTEDELALLGRSLKNQVWFRPPDSKFADGYHKQKYIVMDDFLQTKDTATNPSSDAIDLIRYVNCIPHDMTSAVAELKGHNPCNAEIVVLTSNSHDLLNEIVSLTDARAVTRRIHLPLKVFLKEEYILQDGNQNHTGKYKIDVSKLPKDESGNVIPSVFCYYFQRIYFDKKDSYGRVLLGPAMDFDDVVSLLVSIHRNHKNQYLASLRSFDNIVDNTNIPPPINNRMNLQDYERVIFNLSSDCKRDLIRQCKLACGSIQSIDGALAFTERSNISLRIVDTDKVCNPAIMLHFLLDVNVELKQTILCTRTYSNLNFNKLEIGYAGPLIIYRCGGYIKIVNEDDPTAQGAINDFMTSVKHYCHYNYHYYFSQPHDSAQELDELVEVMTAWNFHQDSVEQAIKHVSIFFNKTIKDVSNAFVALARLQEPTPLDNQLMRIITKAAYVLPYRADYTTEVYGILRVRLTQLATSYYIGEDLLHFDPKEYDGKEGLMFSLRDKTLCYDATIKSLGLVVGISVGTIALLLLLRNTVGPFLSVLTDDDTPEAQGKIAVKLNRYDQLGDAVASMLINDNVYEIIGVNETRLCFITFVKGTTFIINKHCWEDVLKQKVLSIIIRNYSENNPPHRLNIQNATYKIFADRDIAVVTTIPSSIRPKRDITKHFLSIKDVLPRDFKVRLTYREKESLVDIERHARSLEKVRAAQELSFVTDLGYIVKHGEDNFIIKDGFFYEAVTHKGDCGLPITITGDNTKQRRILGIHAVGSQNVQHTFATYVFKEFFDDDIPIAQSAFESLDGMPIRSNQVTTTKLRKSPFYGALGVLELAPADLEVDVVKATERYGNIKPVIDEEVSQTLMDIGVLHVASKVVSRDPRIVSFGEAIFGIEGRKAFKSLNMGSSSGFPYLWSIPGIDGKKNIFGDPDMMEKFTWHEKVVVFDALFEAMQDDTTEFSFRHPMLGLLCFDALKFTIMKIKKFAESDDIVVFVDYLKDEVIRPGKDTRMFSAAPVWYIVLTRMYLGDFCAMLQETRLENPIAIGLNPYSEEWANMYKELSKFKHALPTDFAKFDTSPTPQQFMNLAQSLVKFVLLKYTPLQKKIVHKIFLALAYSTHLTPIYTLIFWAGNTVSGSPLTTLLNCFFQLHVWLYIWYRCVETITLVHLFFVHVIVKLFGDDGALTMDKYARDLMTPENITRFSTELGYNIQSAFKDREMTYCTIDELEFLKRSFKFDSVMGRIVAPLVPKSIMKQIYWYRVHPDSKEIIKKNIYGALLEASFHGPEFFEECRDLIYQRSLEVGFAIEPPPSYEVAVKENAGRDALGEFNFF